jgi:hypothetical protein
MLLLVAALAVQSPGETPATKLAQVYSEYRNPDFSPFVHPERYFAPRLLKAVREDERLAGQGKVGYLDWDPLCQCQDSAGLQARVVSVKVTSHTSAIARVRLDFSPPAEPWKSTVTISLIETSRGWRIADVSSADEPSLLRELEASNRRQRSRRR